LEEEGGLETHFELCETLYVKAKIKSVDKVCVWLGVRTIIFGDLKY
jgi:prefoldin subunit 5